MKNKKIKMIIILVIVGILLFTLFAYALITEKFSINQNVSTATVKIENKLLIEDKLNKTMGETIPAWQPGDASLLKLETTNIGTSAIYTKHTLQIYWNDEMTDSVNKYLYVYPANMSNSEILEDIASQDPKYAVKSEKDGLIETDKGNRIGFQYAFLGDVLDGTSIKGHSKEKNYNSEHFPKTTDEEIADKDIIAFKIVLDPNISYLYQNKKISLKLLTEAMQYTQEGKEEWQIVDTQEIE